MGSTSNKEVDPFSFDFHWQNQYCCFFSGRQIGHEMTAHAHPSIQQPSYDHLGSTCHLLFIHFSWCWKVWFAEQFQLLDPFFDSLFCCCFCLVSPVLLRIVPSYVSPLFFGLFIMKETSKAEPKFESSRTIAYTRNSMVYLRNSCWILVWILLFLITLQAIPPLVNPQFGPPTITLSPI